METADRMIGQIEELVAEIERLRADNESLRREVRDAVSLMGRASAALGGARGRGRRSAVRVEDEAAAPVRRRGRPPKTAGRGRGRATPAAVTLEVVRAAIGKLGTATARDIADEISRAGVPVTGRAIRFLAEQAGAKVDTVDGQRRYRL